MMNEFRRMAAAMDQHMRQLADEGVLGAAALYRMMGHQPDLHRIWTETSDQQLRALCNEYPGFYGYARLMEEAAEAERQKPAAAYRDLPELPEALKRTLTAILVDAATLERGYQATFDTGKEQENLAPLDALHRRWSDQRVRFLTTVKEAGLLEVAEFLAPHLEDMAQRIALVRKSCQ